MVSCIFLHDQPVAFFHMIIYLSKTPSTALPASETFFMSEFPNLLEGVDLLANSAKLCNPRS